MPQTLSVTEVTLKHFNLSVTLRDNGESAEILEELAYRTIGAWLWIAVRLEQGVYTIPAENAGSVESRYAAYLSNDDTDGTKTTFEFAQTFGDSRVTVWDSYRGAKRINFHLNSDDDLQTVVNTWLATQNATKRAFEKWGDVESKLDHAKTSQSIQDTPPASAPTTEAMATPKSQNAPSAPVEGAIVATRAPSKTRQYPDGQFLQFSINKIVKGTNKGSVTYNLWGDLGKNYALKTIYMTKSGSDEKSQDYIASKDVLEGLNLSVDAGKIEAHGNWKLVTKVAHGKNGKGEETEFFNAISLTAI